MMSHTATASTRKRTHLKPSQVATLQDSFNNNPLPDSSVRSRLARELAVTERTIQIWFQNRRAKARKIEASSAYGNTTTASMLRPGWMESTRHHQAPPRYQATFRTMMTPERFEELKQDNQHSIRRRPRSSSKPEPKSSNLLTSNLSNRAMSEDLQNYSNMFPVNSSLGSSQSPLQMVLLPVSVLRVGSWTRFAHASPNIHHREWDLVCYGNPVEREFVWRVQAEGHQFRIQINFDDIHHLRLSQQIQVETGELVGQIDLETQLPLKFTMSQQAEQWIQCGDFTQDKQASVDGLHILQGSHDAFKRSLLDLISLAPDLATKISVNPIVDIPPAQHPPSLDLCRDFTMSPSSTPEPSCVAAIPPHLMYHAPFFYPTDSSEDLYPMLQHNSSPLYPSVL
ncbi:homeobox-domain-containing protein [Backusella circina FSU 941]|nr:homeobox-domain-containing protein [Backusella circina FSU 941]